MKNTRVLLRKKIESGIPSRGSWGTREYKREYKRHAKERQKVQEQWMRVLGMRDSKSGNINWVGILGWCAILLAILFLG